MGRGYGIRKGGERDKYTGIRSRGSHTVSTGSVPSSPKGSMCPLPQRENVPGNCSQGEGALGTQCSEKSFSSDTFSSMTLDSVLRIMATDRLEIGTKILFGAQKERALASAPASPLSTDPVNRPAAPAALYLEPVFSSQGRALKRRGSGQAGNVICPGRSFSTTSLRQGLEFRNACKMKPVWALGKASEGSCHWFSNCHHRVIPQSKFKASFS